jgi:uncharacterized protein YegJ (DUF2314 family)
MRIVKTTLLFAIIASVSLFLTSCTKSASSNDDPTVSVSADDPQMNAAIDQARKSVQQFIMALQSSKILESNFSVKKRFDQGEEVEHIWLTDITFDGQNFHGKVGNDPEEVKNIKLGDDAVVDKNEISDWMYIENGKLVGGYTIRVLYSRMTSDEKKDFLKGMPFSLE